MSTAGGIVIAIFVLLIAAAVGWVVFTQLRARRLGVRLIVLFCDNHLIPCCPPAMRDIAAGPRKTFPQFIIADLIL